MYLDGLCHCLWVQLCITCYTDVYGNNTCTFSQLGVTVADTVCVFVFVRQCACELCRP